MSSDLISVNFDKTVYHAGDTVQVKLKCEGPFSNNLRRIILEAKSYEEVNFKYGTGDNKKRIHKTIIFSHVTKEINISNTFFSPINEELVFSLPDMLMPPINSPFVKIKHEIQVKYDIAHKTDKTLIIPIPYDINYDAMKIEAVNFIENKYSVKLSKSIIFPGDQLDIEFHATPPIDARSIRIEFFQEGKFHVGKYRKTHFTKKQEIQKLEAVNSFNIITQVPELNTNEYHGKNYSVKTYVKIILDKKLRPDKNLLIPVQYYSKKSFIQEKQAT